MLEKTNDLLINNAINELKSTKLFQYLEKLDKNLAECCFTFVSHVAPILATINRFFPYYTRHDANHSYNVIRRIEQIVFSDCLQEGNNKSLSNVDAFLLIIAAYGHDLGMAILPGEEDVILDKLKLLKQPGWETNKKLQEYLRKTHSERGGEYIVSNQEITGIPIHFVQLLNLLNRSHNYSQNALYNNVGRRYSSNSQEINLIQLACILCSADLLEFSETRVLDGVINLLEQEIQQSDDLDLLISLRENLKHAFISANLSIGIDGRIVMNGTFTDPEVLNLTYKTVEYIEKWIRDYCDIDHSAPERKLRLSKEPIYTTFEIPGKEFEKLGIRMNKQNVISLISSNAVWNNKAELVLRELLQNSVEACRYRQFHSPISANYKPKILVKFDKKDRKITISDNGCGMSRSVILNNFLTVGNSRAKEPDYIQSDYSTLARFGIGFWSVFTIASRAQIQTVEYIPGESNENASGVKFDVSINILNDYIIFDKFSGAAGTEITLDVKNNISLSQLINNLTGPFGVICCSDIPIEINYWNNQIVFNQEPNLPNLNDLFGAKTSFIEKEGVSIFSTKRQLEDITLYNFIIYRKSGTSVSFLLSNEDPISLAPFKHYDIKCVCGFVVKGFGSFPIHQIINTTAVGFISNKTNPKGFEYSINRQSLLNTTESEEYFKKVDLLLIDIYRDFLKSVSSYNPINIVRLYEEGRRSGFSGGIVDTSNKLELIMDVAPDLYCFKLYKVEHTSNYKISKIEYYNITDLLNKDYILINATHFFSIHSGYRKYFDYQSEHYYEFCKTLLINGKDSFYVKRGEGDTLFNNDPNSYIVFKKIIGDSDLYSYVTFYVSHTKSINPKSSKDWVIGMVQGVWTGYICEKKVIGSKFAFGQHNCYIEPNSNLSKEIRKLYKENMYPEICSIIVKLEQSLFGYTDPSIEQFL